MASQTSSRPGKGGAVRSIVAALCLLIGFVLTIPAVVAFWGNRTFLDTENYVDTVVTLSADAQIQAAMGRKVSAAVENNLDINALVADRLGDAIDNEALAQRTEARLRRTVPALIDQVTAEVLASEAFANLWAETNRVLHTRLLAALAGEPAGPVGLTDGQLVLDTTPVVEQVKRELGARGIEGAADLPIATSDRQIVLLSSDEVRELQTVYRYADPLANWLLLLAAVVYFVGVLFARRRGLMVVLTGVAVALSGTGLLLLLAAGQREVQERFADQQFAEAAAEFYSTLVANLRVAGLVMVVGGVLLAVVVLGIRRVRRRGPDQPSAPEAPRVGAQT